MLKRALVIAMAMVGLVIGAGFASGQELLQFFVSFGLNGLWGVLISLVVMVIGSVAIMQLGSYLHAREHTAVFNRVASPAVAAFLDYAIMFGLFCLGFVMISGAGSNLNQQFGWPTWVGSVILLVLLIGMGFLDVDRVSKIIGLVTPMIIVLIILGAVVTFFNSDWDIDRLSQVAGTIEHPLGAGQWWLAAINYVGLNLVCGGSMAVVISGSSLDTKAAGIGGLIAGIVFTLLLLAATTALFLNVDVVKDDDVPMLTLLYSIHPIVGLVMALTIYLMIFNTAVGNFYSLAKRMTRKKPDWFRPVYFVTVGIGFVFGFLPFDRLVNVVFPILGYLGIVLFVVLAVAWVRGRPLITTEENRRNRVRRLLAKRLDPREQYTRRDRAELHRIAAKSNISDRQLLISLVGEVEEELEGDSDLDYEAKFGDLNELDADKDDASDALVDELISAEARPGKRR